MFGFLFHGLHAFLSDLTWVALVVFAILSLVCVVVKQIAKPLVSKLTWFYLAEMACFAATGVLILIKITAFVTYILTAQHKINDLQGQLNGKQATIDRMTADASRKSTQQTDVKTGDDNVDIRYVPKYRTIESIRLVPDLSLANKLALDVTTNFYNPDKADEQVPAKQ